MKFYRRAIHQFLRWQAVIFAVSALAPALVLCGLGVIWLFEHSALFEFVVITALIGLCLTLIHFALQRLPAPAPTPQQQAAPEIEANPEWSAQETHAFTVLCTRIQQQTAEFIAWQKLPELSLEVVTQAAVLLKGDATKPLDFSAPEALLLIEQTAKRYRQHLRDHIPFTDQVSITQIQWLWRNRKRFSAAWQLADGGRRLARFMTNPSGAAIKELELLMGAGQSQYISDQLASTLQTLLLEEVAASAIDLYSGRLRFSEAELRQIALDTVHQDNARLAKPDDPLRILIIGQTSAGKSTFINHLIEDHLAEVDAAPTTSALTSYQGNIHGVDCFFIDTPGITGEPNHQRQLVTEITQSDMVLWLMRADRPARSADAALAGALAEWQQRHIDRRPPPLIPVITHIDRLCEHWPYPEHHIPADELATITQACTVAAAAINTSDPIALGNGNPAWNLHTVYQRMDEALTEAAMTQRNRRRLAGEHKLRAISSNAKRGAKGAYRSTRALMGKWLGKSKP